MLMRMLMLAPIDSGLQQIIDKGIKPALFVLMTLISIVLIVIVLMQKGDSGDISAVTGGKSANSYHSKNRATDKGSILKRWTYILGAALLINSLAYFLISIIGLQ